MLLSVGYACRQDQRHTVTAPSAAYQKAESLVDIRNDSAFYYYNLATSVSKDSLEIAKAYNGMAQIQSDAGDYFGSQESLTLSLKFLREQNGRDQSCLSADYNELGTNSLKLKNYGAAIDFYRQAIRLTKNNEYQATIANNQGNAWQKLKNYSEALKLYQQAMMHRDISRKTYARILTNMAITKWLRLPGYDAAPELRQALQLRLAAKDRWGQNASYARLSDFYTRARPDSALFYARQLYTMATVLDNPDDRLEALQKLILLSPATDGKPYFEQYQNLSDSVQTARAAARNQFALIRYGSEKNKADNLVLQYQVIKQRVVLYSGLFVFVGLAFLAVRWYHRKKQLQLAETREAVKETQRKASKTVHDALGNDIYRILKNVQNKPVLDRGWLEEHIDGVYKRARNLSYEINIPADERFAEHLSSLLQSFGTEAIRVVLVGNQVHFWQKFDPSTKLELHYVLQELMVNMQKHSGAGNVVVKFELEGGQGRITYFDDGAGIAPGTAHQNGLVNTGSRIKAINGTIIFESHAGKGLEIQLTFPIV